MSFESILSLATGVFGGSPSDAPTTEDIFTPGSLARFTGDSNIQSAGGGGGIFDMVSPKGLPNLLNDPTVQSLMSQSGQSIDQVISSSINSLPRDVNSFGDIFDSGEFSFGSVMNIANRVGSTLNSSQFDSIGQGDFGKLISLTSAVSFEVDQDGDLQCLIDTNNGANRNLGRRTRDESALGGFLAAMISKLAGNGCLYAIMPLISDYSNELGIDSGTMDSVNRVLAKDISNDGRLQNAIDLIQDVGPSNFNASERVAMADAMVNNYKKPEYANKNQLSVEASLMTAHLDTLNPGWSKKNVNGAEVTDIEVFKKSSDDFKEVMSYNSEFETIIALSKSQFA